MHVVRRALLLIGCLICSFSAFAQQSDKVYRIGFFGTGSRDAIVTPLDALWARMRGLGYVEGKNLTIDYRWGEGKTERLPGLAAELLRFKPDALVVWGTAAAMAAKRATSTLPIMLVNVGDPVETGLVASLARPGGNITGLSNLGGAVTAKQMEILMQVIPGAARIGVLNNPGNASLVPQMKGAESGARALRLQLSVHDVRSGNDLDAAFAAMAAARADAVLSLADPLLFTEARRVAELALKYRLPTVTARGEMADAGILLAYGASTVEQFREGAIYLDKILRGARPADLPVQQASIFELVVNLKTARSLNITIPQLVLGRADRVIE